MKVCLVKTFEHLLADENWKPQVPVAELYKGLSQLQVAFDDDHADDDADPRAGQGVQLSLHLGALDPAVLELAVAVLHFFVF